MINLLKSNKGIAAQDALIALLIITLFTGIIGTLIFNIYVSNTSIKRMSKANSYVVDTIEYIDKLYYDELANAETAPAKIIAKYPAPTYTLQDVTATNAGNPEQGANLERIWRVTGTLEQGYTIDVYLDRYVPEGEDSLDLVSKITVKVQYKVGRKNQEITVSRVKSRENLETPNRPDLSPLKAELQEEEYIKPVKELYGTYVICSEQDIDWYQYSNEGIDKSNTAKVIISNEDLNIGTEIEIENEEVYEWIPRHVEDEENIKYLYRNTNNYVETYTEGNNTYQKITALDGEYNTEFEENETGKWRQF